MNNVSLTGIVYKDPQLKYIKIEEIERPFLRLGLIVKKRLSKERLEDFLEKGKHTSDFIFVNIWGRKAETCFEYIKKGSKIAVEGSFSTTVFETNNNIKKFSIDVIARNIDFLTYINLEEDNEDYTFMNELEENK